MKKSSSEVHFLIVQIIRWKSSGSVSLDRFGRLLEKRDYNLAKELAEQHPFGPKQYQYRIWSVFGDIHIESSQQGTTLSPR